jgi:alpha-N-arabinofuranosidase
MNELVIKHSAIMDKYDADKKIALVVDEWGGWYDVEKGTNPGFLYQQNTMRDAMIAGLTLNIFNNHCDRVRMACLAQTINVLQAVILTNEEKMIKTPTYYVMEMYKVHQNARMIPLELSTTGYESGSDKLPAISASASADSLGRVHISVVNIDAKKSQSITIDLKKSKYSVSGRALTSANLQDHNTFDHPDKIKPAVFKDFIRRDSKLSFTLSPFSVVVLEVKND